VDPAVGKPAAVVGLTAVAIPAVAVTLVVEDSWKVAFPYSLWSRTSTKT
jgi:hypothetical protein